MSYAKLTSSINLRLVISPFLVLLVLQIPGCTLGKGTTPPPPAGGTYRSSNAGATFEQSVAVSGTEGAHVAGYPLGVIHRISETPSTIYIAAGNGGIIFSTDDGQTWQRVATPLQNTSDVLLLSNGTIVAAGVGADGQGYIIRSLDQGRIWDTVHTVPVPTKTGFIQRLVGGSAATSVITSLAVDPFEPDRVYAGTTLGSIFVGEQSAKVWRLLHALDASKLSGVQTGSAQMGIRTLYASPYAAGELILLTTENRVVRVWNDKQEHVRIPMRDELPTTSLFDSGRRVLDFALIDRNTLLVGTGDGAVISRDNGKTWQSLDLPVETNTVFNSVTVAASPTNTQRLFVTINDVLYRSEDGGRNWNIHSLELLQLIISDFSIHPNNPSTILLTTNALRT